MTTPRILVAGVGNIFLGDDAFGVEVVQRLLRREWPAEVRVADFGIRGIDLTYALLDGYETVVLVDATPRGGEPGTLYLLEAEPGAQDDSQPANLFLEPHALHPEKVLRMAASMGSGVRRVLVVGCEPAVADEDVMGLSEPVRRAVEEAVGMIESLVARLLAESQPCET